MGDKMQNNMIQYVVMPNDTLYFIAKKYNTTVEELKNVNHLYSNMIYPNQILFIPKTNSGCKTYVTVDNESIAEILNKAGITMAKLLEYNDIEKLKVEGNQLLCVNNNENNIHKASANDTIEYVLKKYNLTPLELLKLNERLFLAENTEIIIK